MAIDGDIARLHPQLSPTTAQILKYAWITSRIYFTPFE